MALEILKFPTWSCRSRISLAGVPPLMPPTAVAPGSSMIFLRDPDGRTIELAQFADGATCSAEYTCARG